MWHRLKIGDDEDEELHKQVEDQQVQIKHHNEVEKKTPKRKSHYWKN